MRGKQSCRISRLVKLLKWDKLGTFPVAGCETGDVQSQNWLISGKETKARASQVTKGRGACLFLVLMLIVLIVIVWREVLW
jgi:hypothetical protein